MHPIRQLRRAAGLTQAALAAKAGTSQSTIAAYESGSKQPNWSTIERLAAAVGLAPVVSFTPRMQYADWRSLYFHRAAAEVLRQDPEQARERARRHLARLRQMHPHAQSLLAQWAEWLRGPTDELIARMLDPGPAAREMRQVSPLVGLLGPRERVRVLRTARREYRP
jgi:transcriptional regulator with XRE-family HTH domain